MKKQALMILLLTSISFSDEIDVLIKVNEKLVKETKIMKIEIKNLSNDVLKNASTLNDLSNEIFLLKQNKKHLNIDEFQFKLNEINQKLKKIEDKSLQINTKKSYIYEPTKYQDYYHNGNNEEILYPNPYGYNEEILYPNPYERLEKPIKLNNNYNRYVVFLGYFKSFKNANKRLREIKRIDKNVKIYKKNKNPKGFVIKLSYNSTWNESKTKLKSLRRIVPDLFYKTNKN
ncbi:MAG TPA: hypothetical protein EYG89_02165 [Bacteroidia bacterium]|nr:hypothetical protein [Bacteroidia bacterium]